MVTTTINAPPLKAATSSQTNSGADDASAAIDLESKQRPARAPLSSSRCCCYCCCCFCHADARIVDAMLERFTSLVRRPSQELEREREREREKEKEAQN